MRRPVLFARLVLALVIVASIDTAPGAQLLQPGWLAKLDPANDSEH